MGSDRKTINILGATGSIGQSTIKVIMSAPEKFKVHIITGHSQREELFALKEKLGAEHAICTQDEGGLDTLHQLLSVPVDITVSAITGFAGLNSLMRAIETSTIVAIANKEPLVAAGSLVKACCKKHETKILPLDSEHNAIFQVFDFERPHAVEKIILTASGGPFLKWSLDDMRAATPEQAIAHPNWSMGRKISVDSATMMNKALELIEAYVLFDLPSSKIDVLIHPQSVVHSMVEYKDGSVLAQMGASDMCTPIAYALDWPERLATPGNKLDLSALQSLSFEAVDRQKFSAIDMAYDCIRAMENAKRDDWRGARSAIALNAANEVAVDAFLNKEIGFLDILECVRHSLESVRDHDHLEDVEGTAQDDLESIRQYDAFVRETTLEYIRVHIVGERAMAH